MCRAVGRGRRIRASVAAGALMVCGALTPARSVVAQRPDSTGAPRPQTPEDSARAVRLTGVTVTGTRLSAIADARSPVRADVLQTRALPPGPGALPEALAHATGVTVFDDQGTRAQPTIEMRGFSLSPVVGTPQGVSVFLDGVRINEPDAQEINFDLVPMDAVAHAEVIRGPATLFGKNSLAGALVLSTERGYTDPRVEVGTELGPYDYRVGRLTAAGVSHGLDGFLLARASNESGYRVDTGARTRMLFATVGRKHESDDLALSVLVAHDRVSQAGSLPESWIPIDRRANYTVGDFFEPNLVSVTARGDRHLAGIELRGTIFGRQNETEQFNVNVGSPSSRAFVANRSAGGTAELSWLARPGQGAVTLTSTLGAEGAASAVRYRIFQEASGNAPLQGDCDPMSGLCENARVDESDLGAYAQTMIELAQRLTITGSARADVVRVPFRDLRDPANDGTSTFRRVSPRLGATYRVADVLRVYAAVSSGFRAPAALELACADETAPCPLPFALGEDPPLAPVTVWNSEGGLDWQPVPALALDLSAFRSPVRNEIVFVSSQTAAGFFQNIPRTRRQGIETTARLALPQGARLTGSYSLIDATYESEVQLASAIPGAPAAQPGDYFPLSPRHRANVALGVTRLLGGAVLDGELSVHGVSSQYLRGDEANRQPPLPGYTSADLRLGLDLSRYSLSLAVTNLLDRRFNTFGVYGLNPLGPPGGPRPASPILERFLTPNYPRALTVMMKAGL